MPNPDAEVRAAYAAYVTCFQRLDADATADHFAVPLLRVGDGRTTVAGTVGAVRTMLQTLGDRLAGSGYVGVRSKTLQVDVIDAHTALVRATGERVDAHGVAFEQFDVLYMWVRRGEDEPWRIAVLIPVTAGCRLSGREPSAPA